MKSPNTNEPPYADPSEVPAVVARRHRSRRDVPTVLKDDALLNANQLAELIGVDKRTIFRWKAAGQLPDYDFKQGQTCRWKVSTVRTLVAQPERLR